MLLHKAPTQYSGNSFDAHYLEQYKLYAQLKDAHASRLDSTNRFFLTLHVAILAGMFLLLREEVTLDTTGTVALVIASSMFCAVWFLVVLSSSKLNVARYDILKKLEDHLPARPYQTEWETHLGGRCKYVRIGTLYKLLPIAFVILYACMGFVLNN